MYLNEKTNEAPQIKRLSIDFNLRFKPKNGEFDIYDRIGRTTAQLKEIEIIPIADSRFTISEPQQQKDVNVWSGLYKSVQQNITVMQKKDNKVSVRDKGNWESLKTKGYKYTRVLHCLVKINQVWRTCEFELSGISIIMWGKVKSMGSDGIMKLQVSSAKDFDTDRGSFHSIIGGIISEVSQDADEKARNFAKEVQESYDSYDANYDYYHEKDQDKKQADEVDSEKTTEPTTPTTGYEDIPTVNLDEEDEVKIEDVPF